jgi:hypothetical protein
MLALIDDEMPVVADKIVNLTLSYETLNKRNVIPVGRRLPPPIVPILVRDISRKVDRRSTHWSIS